MFVMQVSVWIECLWTSPLNVWSINFLSIFVNPANFHSVIFGNPAGSFFEMKDYDFYLKSL